jgi:DNA mismatch repair ATPase MutS
MERERLKEKYSAEAASFRCQAEKEGKTLLLLSTLRLVTFIGGVILIWVSFTISNSFGIISLFLVVTIFLYLLKSYSLHTSRKEYLVNLEVINTNEEKALSGDYSMFEDGNSFARTGHDFSYDLDIFGASSLFQYLNRTCTGYGRQVLAGWLSDPYSISPLLEKRQKTIAEISAKHSWRQSFLATGLNKSLEQEHISGLTGWLSEESVLNSSVFRKTIIWVLPSLTLISLILMAAGVLHYSVFISFFLLNTFIIFFNLTRSSAIHEDLTGRFRFLSSFGQLLEIIENESFDSPLINRMKASIKGGNKSAVSSLKELSRIIRAFDSRLNVIVGFVFNGLLLWDLHCIRRLEEWKSVNRVQFPVWLEMLGEIDAFISLGNYNYNNPAFVFPSLSEDGIPLNARQMGHQLIDQANRVCNDFTLPAMGKICIITGANMAGKSTFLRSVAVNYILAMAGAPVCAAEFSFIPVRLFTSMRTTDSLSSNESYFYAELKRLKSLEEKLASGGNVFFILDEILKGTNSDDKSQGSKLFINRVISLGGTGLIATHDTSLGAMEKEHPGVITNKCIEVDIDGENISFDYKLRDGIASKKNAVLLMRQMGILG